MCIRDSFSTFDDLVTNEEQEVKSLEDTHLTLDKELDEIGAEIVRTA